MNQKIDQMIGFHAQAFSPRNLHVVSLAILGGDLELHVLSRIERKIHHLIGKMMKVCRLVMIPQGKKGGMNHILNI